VLQLSEGECQQRIKEFPLWELAPDSRSMSRTFVAKSFAEGELMLVSDICDSCLEVLFGSFG
jgi:pterin-4a-carbinolamine dehydratase